MCVRVRHAIFVVCLSTLVENRMRFVLSLLTNRIGRNFLINNPRIQPQANLKLLTVAQRLCKHKERMKIYGRSDVMTIACFCLSLSITSCKKYRSFMFALVKHINIYDLVLMHNFFYKTFPQSCVSRF